MKAWRADPLVWGHGPRIFEVFLEPTCPFSVKAFGKLEDLLDQAGEDGAAGRRQAATVRIPQRAGADLRQIVPVERCDLRRNAAAGGPGLPQLHPASSGGVPSRSAAVPSTRSAASAMVSNFFSAWAGAVSCSPTGKPARSRPTGIVIAQRPR